MRFGPAQGKRFESNNGSYSIVTDREYYDSQITLADYESKIVIDYFEQESIHVGNVGSNKILSQKVFRLHPSGETINLNVVFPKPNKTELRLYISSSAGFKPKAGFVWFLYVKDDELWIGSMAELDWRSESSALKVDNFDDAYQELIDEPNPVRQIKIKERDVYARDRNIALKRMEESGYRCQYDPSHKLFVSRFSKKQYLEAHHLVPVAMQPLFKDSLDCANNVFCLCPYCHRVVHHAEKEEAREILAHLAEKSSALEQFSLNLDDLFGCYAVEEINIE